MAKFKGAASKLGDESHYEKLQLESGEVSWDGETVFGKERPRASRPIIHTCNASTE